VIVLVVLAIGFVGVFYLHYQDMVKPIPDFDSLKQVAADGMKYTVSKHSFSIRLSSLTETESGFKQIIWRLRRRRLSKMP